MERRGSCGMTPVTQLQKIGIVAREIDHDKRYVGNRVGLAVTMGGRRLDPSVSALAFAIQRISLRASCAASARKLFALRIERISGACLPTGVGADRGTIAGVPSSLFDAHAIDWRQTGRR